MIDHCVSQGISGLTSSNIDCIYGSMDKKNDSLIEQLIRDGLIERPRPYPNISLKSWMILFYVHGDAVASPREAKYCMANNATLANIVDLSSSGHVNRLLLPLEQEGFISRALFRRRHPKKQGGGWLSSQRLIFSHLSNFSSDLESIYQIIKPFSDARISDTAWAECYSALQNIDFFAITASISPDTAEVCKRALKAVGHGSNGTHLLPTVSGPLAGYLHPSTFRAVNTDKSVLALKRANQRRTQPTPESRASVSGVFTYCLDNDSPIVLQTEPSSDPARLEPNKCISFADAIYSSTGDEEDDIVSHDTIAS